MDINPKSAITVEKIVRNYLIRHRFDGLYNDGCGCAIDLLVPCGQIRGDCMPGYVNDCSTCISLECKRDTTGFDFIVSDEECYK